VVHVTAAWLDSIAKTRSHFNIKQIDRIDSLYRAGHFGTVGDDKSLERAHLLARLTVVNAYRDLARLACDQNRVYEADEKTLEAFVARYSDVLLFSAMRLERVRMGLGHVCMWYNLDDKVEGRSWHGGKCLRWRVKDDKVAGEKRRVLSIDVPTGVHETVEAILLSHHHFKVEYQRIDGPPAPYEWFLVYDIEGAWIRKWGTHKPTAYMFWVTSPFGTGAVGSPLVAVTSSASHRGSADIVFADADGTGATEGSGSPARGLEAGLEPDFAIGVEMPLELPPVPMVGIRMYIKGLRFKLPSFLPDINLDDLREIELAMPILDMRYLKETRQPAWLGRDADCTFAEWKGFGDVPPDIRERFPDR
jgi:hypothetical protein